MQSVYTYGAYSGHRLKSELANAGIEFHEDLLSMAVQANTQVTSSQLSPIDMRHLAMEEVSLLKDMGLLPKSPISITQTAMSACRPKQKRGPVEVTKYEFEVQGIGYRTYILVYVQEFKLIPNLATI